MSVCRRLRVDSTSIVAAIDAADGTSLTSGVASVGSESDGLVYGSVSQALTSADVDVLVDDTSATAVKEHAWSAVEAESTS